jgi:hypothetical protein
MALGTLTKVGAYVNANRRVRVYDVQLTSGANYAAGGETITPQQVGLSRKIEQVAGLGIATTATGATSRQVVPLYQTNGSVKLTVQTAGATEAVAATDQSTFSARLTFIGF